MKPTKCQGAPLDIGLILFKSYFLKCAKSIYELTYSTVFYSICLGKFKLNKRDYVAHLTGDITVVRIFKVNFSSSICQPI